jgi:hypothetical protein
MRPLSLRWTSLLEKRAQAPDLDALRRDLEAEHARLAINLRAAHDLLETLRQPTEQTEFDDLLLGYKTLITIAERENFINMPPERMAVVIAQVTSRLDRLGQMLRDMQVRGLSAVATTLH